MGPIQKNAIDFNPDGLPMTLGATYSRKIAASLARAWENVLDWEHLPHLHSSSFSTLTLQDAGGWGWRALTTGNPPTKGSEALIELVVDRDRNRYVSRTLRGGLPGMETWTQFTRLSADTTQVDVEFHMPHLNQHDAEKLGHYMTSLYTTLWDEDEKMMVERQIALNERTSHKGELERDLGPIDTLMKQLPLNLSFQGQNLKIVNLKGKPIAFRPTCPHMLAPLDQAEVDETGSITCPWHGYRFDLSSGKCTDGHDLRLADDFVLTIESSGNVVISAKNDGQKSN